MSTAQTAVMKQIPDAAEYESLLPQIKQVERAYKIGDVDQTLASPQAIPQVRWVFEEEIDRLDGLVRKHKERFLREQPSWYYKFLAIQAEAKEYFDTSTPAYRLDLYLLAQQLYRQLPKRVAATQQDNQERVILKNMIRVIVAGLEYLYSIGDFGTAIVYADGLRDFVTKRGLATDEDPANGTLAVIYYFLGRTYRQRGVDDDYQKAIDYFYQSSESYFEMARRSNREVNVIYARTRAMVSLAFGAGFLFYNAQSDLVRAKGLIAQARLAFLRDSGEVCCKLHYYYLELLYASILRAEAGEIVRDETGDDELQAEVPTAQEKLNRAMNILERCEQELKNKPKYLIHTLYNQALVYLYQGPAYYDRVRECITQMIERSPDNPRWLANGLVLRSHLERRVGAFDLALGDAIKAYNHSGNHVPVRIEALLARGQAQLARHHFSAAQADFEKAHELNNGANLKLTAMALLLLVEVHIAQHKLGQARETFTKATAIMPSIRHGFIKNRFRQLERWIDNLQTDFVICGIGDEVDYKKLDSALQRWLLEKVLREENNLTRAAEKLNVSKKTVYLWLEKYEMKV